MYVEHCKTKKKPTHFEDYQIQILYTRDKRTRKQKFQLNLQLNGDKTKCTQKFQCEWGKMCNNWERARICARRIFFECEWTTENRQIIMQLWKEFFFFILFNVTHLYFCWRISFFFVLLFWLWNECVWKRSVPRFF